MKNTYDSNFVLSSRDERGSGLDRTGSGLKPILAGSGLDRTATFLKITRSGLDWTEKNLLYSCDYYEHIKKFSCDPVFADLQA